MNVIICDDDYKYVESIKQNVSSHFDEQFHNVSFDTYTDGDIIINSNVKRYDIAFLDIEIGNVKGTDVARKLKETNPNIVIFFITAYTSYLDDAMDLDAFRFLTKPLDIKRLFEGLDRAMDLIDNTVFKFLMKNNNGVCKICASDIIFVEICGRSTKIITEKNTFVSEYPINYWVEKLTSSYFYNVHKSYIVNTNHITKYNRESLILDNQYEIPIANAKRSQFRRYFLNKIEGR